MTESRQRSLWIKLAVLLCSSLFCVGGAEVAARLWHRISGVYPKAKTSPEPGRFKSWPYVDRSQHLHSQSNASVMDHSTYVGYISKAGWTGRGYHTNAQGFRYDEDLPREKAPREIRIFVTGGSVAWGSGVRQDQLYSTLLEKSLNEKHGASGCRIRVISTGVIGHVSTQERIIVENIVLDYAPDIVVMLTGANDIYNGYRGNDILRNQDFLDIRDTIERRGNPLFVIDGFPEAMHAFDPPRIDQYHSRLHFLWDEARYNRALASGDLERKIRASSLPVEQTLERTLRNIHLLRTVLRREGVALAVYLQPYLTTTSKKLTDWEEDLLQVPRSKIGWPEYSVKAYALYREKLPLDAKVEEYQYEDGDVAAAREAESIFVDGFHFGDRGNQLIAVDLASFLEPLISERVKRL